MIRYAQNEMRLLQEQYYSQQRGNTGLWIALAIGAVFLLSRD